MQQFSALKNFPAGLNITGGAAEMHFFDNGNSGSSIALNLDNGNMQKVTVSAAATISFAAPTMPGTMLLKVKQDGTGHAYTLSGVKYPGGVSPTYSSGANQYDWIAITFDGTDVSGNFSGNFS